MELDIVNSSNSSKNENKFVLLNEKLTQCEAKFRDLSKLKDDDPEKFEKLKQIIYIIEVNPKYTYEFLRIMKLNELTYSENEEKWDFKRNFDLLEKTLTSYDYHSLANKDKVNPLKSLIQLLKELSVIKDGDYSKYQNNLTSLEFNFPFIEGTLGLRIEYYINYLTASKNISNVGQMEQYINKIDNDPEIAKSNVDECDFNIKLALLILHITENISANMDFVNYYFIKGIVREKYPISKYISKKDKLTLTVKNLFEKIDINIDDYVIPNLINDITIHPKYPLKTLLLRNESYKKFIKDGGFLKQLGLYTPFINYLKKFIKSKAITDLLSFHEYENIAPLLTDDKYLDEILNSKHLKFLPFISPENKFGHSNKDLVISIINISPYIVNFPLTMENYSLYYKELYFLSILFSLGVIFITCLHEVLEHLTYAYIFYCSEKNISSESPKTKKNEGDGGYALEEKLTGDTKFSSLNIQMIITLFNGISCEKGLESFRNELCAKCDMKKINKDLFNNGFLSVLIEKFDVDFEKLAGIPDINNFHVSCREGEGIYFNMGDRKPCTKIKGGIPQY